MKYPSNLRNVSIISGTLRAQDLVPAFASLLSELDSNKEYAELLSVCDRAELTDEHLLDALVHDLIQALDELAPFGCRFGAHQDDGADFGYWEMDASEEY